MTKEMKKLIKLVVIAILFVTAIGFVYNLGYNKAVKSAYLVSVNEHTHNDYVIAFDDEGNHYTGDWVELYTEPSNNN